MTTTTATQAQTDADTFATFIGADSNYSEAGRQLGVGASTVRDRVRRHLARQAADAAADVTTDVPAAQDTPAQNAPADDTPVPDYTQWTGAQLYTILGMDPARVLPSVDLDAVRAEIERRKAAGPDDGSRDRVDAMNGHAPKDRTGHAAEKAQARAESKPAKGSKPEPERVTECVKCGFKFTKPQVRKTCQSDKACQRRQDAARAEAAQA
jgi:hypothetical protein